MKYLILFENFGIKDRTDTDRMINLSMSPGNQKKNYQTLFPNKYKFDKQDIYNLLTDIIDTYPDLHFEIEVNEIPYLHFIIYLYHENSTVYNRGYDLYTPEAKEKYSKMPELVEDLNARLLEIGMGAWFDMPTSSWMRIGVYGIEDNEEYKKDMEGFDRRAREKLKLKKN